MPRSDDLYQLSNGLPVPEDHGACDHLAGKLFPSSVAKVTINHLTKFLAKHCGLKVRTNAIAPGFIKTSRTENFDEAVNKFKTRTPLKRTGELNDIAELVKYYYQIKLLMGKVFQLMVVFLQFRFVSSINWRRHPKATKAKSGRLPKRH
ncbi:SDR family oxidoreductase [Coxiella endosymbiont of Ornithodoros amblus]|uniref:SDR family oxidoreductase n=1 Tax=Coxiella endosymbiont of Ornithodoros amblus TaxID=1656166 RepID=UPI00244DA250|nr:SDR family oxidoreductase [Coxiella endosymbiont of Ornithodoros amblus]